MPSILSKLFAVVVGIVIWKAFMAMVNGATKVKRSMDEDAEREGLPDDGKGPVPQARRDFLDQWQEAVVRLDRMVYDDARKEFDLNSQTGFGADGDRQQAEADFEEVRGSFESNSFVKAVLEHIERKSELGNKMRNKLAKIQ